MYYICILPTDTSSAAAKDEFYKDINEPILGIPPLTIIMVTGGFNTRIGKDSHNTNQRIVGPAYYYEITKENFTE